MYIQKLDLKYTFILMLSLLTLLSACESDDDNEFENEQELITTVEIVFTDDQGNVSTFLFQDLDGEGGMAPVIDQIDLLAGTTYTTGIRFLDESDPTDAEDITEEVRNEDEEHLVCYDATGAMPAPVVQDTDASGDPLGIVTMFNTTTAGSGQLTIRLKHLPNKGAASPCSTGETDVEVTFEVTVM